MSGITFGLADLLVFATALAVSVIATPAVRSLAVRWRIGNKPNGRAINRNAIPHLGGIALFLGVAAAMAFSLLRESSMTVTVALLLRAIPAVLLIVVLGLVDDTRSLPARRKLAFQLLASASVVAVGFRIFTGMWVFDASGVALAMVSLVFVVGMLSSVNLVDGHDGLAAGVAMLSAAAFAVIAAMLGMSEVLALSLAMCGACLGFLVFNFPPGRIYMGDTGSMLLGLLLSLGACLITMRAPSVNTFAAVCMALGVPLLDTMLAIARRIVLRSPLFGADTLHMHHVLRDAGLSPRRTLVVLYGMQAFFSLLAVGAAMGWVLPVVVGLGFVTVAFVSFLRMMVEGRETAETVPHHGIAKTIPFQSSFTANIPERRTSVGP
ncbi:MAG: undecaprenyl/decaprenyl-phosphate alpha-N-acetylglucosaminyl 1-phosphate transferase [Candidatus Krumholzibacteria bacterium]|nr:undecaprenyl/decaprenyl-phosphate alpha-N-acetylglucosaminyl 1-phosphate transferase [Candidatus Krumholzibacteria bacterium]MDH4336958.1 undecaprenyl/decaprenyl-phosphate alpha-N-acetylglucosaminyl 1-phosphate transferase [Candidatus Krumholzibacteria bacterium]MDH5269746.1 undecaprenyl/decaprenyl-phosphate alpha-N-acetylglucosaminyl 1-phosphate transferase [Candidatus Krumholzibacteria bacterium]MDH5627486.1 undecaprenyl/decaprenyl-phosphate alpha-N-acetylglucosaminyl 1-phosphate transferas